jgi:hypothetical protein
MTKDKIYPGDTYPVQYQIRKKDPDDLADTQGLPQAVVSGFAQVLDGNTGEFLELGGVDVTTAPVTVVAPTGSGRYDRGATITYRVPAAFTATPGTYTLFITITLSDGSIQTENRKYVVNEFR